MTVREVLTWYADGPSKDHHKPTEQPINLGDMAEQEED